MFNFLVVLNIFCISDIFILFCNIYLNNGTGKACAGHKIVRLLFTEALKLLELSIEGNFGDTRPTGSKDTTSK